VAIVVDDHLLLDLLTNDPDEWLRAETDHSAGYTMAARYYRLANASHRGSGDGALSRKLALLPEGFQRERIDNLSDRIGFVGPRLLVPVMASLPTRRRPNVLAAEALAVALVTGSSLVVSTDGALLREGARDLDIDYRVLAA
jgi:hypothetical protein